MSSSAPSFEALLAAHMIRVHRAALGWLGDEQEAHEVAQEALLKAYKARGRYDPERPFYPWLHTIVRNACRDAAARGEHCARPGLQLDRVQSAEPNALAILGRAEAESRLHAALSTLTEDHRRILVMRHFEELSYAEIAGLLSVPEGTVMSRLYRARKALAAAMETT